MWPLHVLDILNEDKLNHIRAFAVNELLNMNVLNTLYFQAYIWVIAKFSLTDITIYKYVLHGKKKITLILHFFIFNCIVVLTDDVTYKVPCYPTYRLKVNAF